MRTLLHLVRKDLRRAAPGLFAWFLLQLTANVAVWLVREQPPGTSLVGTVGAAVSACVILVNLILSFLVATRLVSEDPPGREDGTWRLLPIGPTQLFLSKCASSLLCSFLPAAAALLPFVFLSGWGPQLAVASFLGLLLCNGIAALAGIGFTPLGIRHVSSPVIQVVSAGLVITLGINVVIRFSLQADTWVFESRLFLSALLLLGGLLASAWLHYRVARRFPALGCLCLSVALSCMVLATWDHPTVDLLLRRGTVLSCEPLRTECGASGAARVTQVLGLRANQRFDEYPQWLGGKAVVGEMWLGGLREPARLSLQCLPRASVDRELLLDTLPQDPVPQKARLGFLHPGPNLGENHGDIMNIPKEGISPAGILSRLAPLLPRLRGQEYVRPGFSVRIRGHIHEKGVVFDFPLRVGARGSRPGVELTLVKLLRLPDGRLGLEMVRNTLSDSFHVRRSFVVDRKSGRYWQLDYHSWTSGAALGFVFSHRNSMDCEWPPQVSNTPGTAGQESMGLDGLRYVELGDEVLSPAVVALSQEEVHEEIAGFSDELVARYEKQVQELEKRRKAREQRQRERN